MVASITNSVLHPRALLLENATIFLNRRFVIYATNSRLFTKEYPSSVEELIYQGTLVCPTITDFMYNRSLVHGIRPAIILYVN